jgi:hypothetical protein
LPEVTPAPIDLAGFEPRLSQSTAKGPAISPSLKDENYSLLEWPLGSPGNRFLIAFMFLCL